jgi:hypothetical protein
MTELADGGGFGKELAMNAKRILAAMLFVGVIGVTAVGCVPSGSYPYSGGGYYYAPAAHHRNSSGYNSGHRPAVRRTNHSSRSHSRPAPTRNVSRGAAQNTSPRIAVPTLEQTGNVSRIINGGTGRRISR